MERKRVRVYKPGGMTNNISLNAFQLGGSSDMAANMPAPPSMQGGDTSAQLQQIVMSYAQANGMEEQEAQQLMQSILKMPADQQQQAVQQMTQELNQAASQNTMARFGGNMKNTKRLLKKAIGGALSDGESSENVVDARKETISNVLGANMARNIVDQAAKDSLNATGIQTSQQQVVQPNGIQSPMQPISGAAMARYGGAPRFDIGGGYENPFYNNNMQGAQMGAQDFADRRQGALDATRGFMGSLKDLTGDLRTKTVVKRKGDLFEHPEWFTQQGTSGVTTNTAPNQGFFQQDADENVIPDYLQQNYAQWYNSDLMNKKNGGVYNMYQTAGTTYDPNVQGSSTLADAKSKYAQYNISDYTGLMNLYNQGKLPMSDFYNVADAYGITIPANPAGTTTANPTTTTNTNNTTTTNTNNTSGGYTGPLGPYYFKDGVNMGPIADLQGTGVNGYNFANIAQGAAGVFGMPTSARDFMKGMANPANLKAFGNAISGFQPEGVFLDKVKGRVGPFGAKFKMTWEYGPDGKPVQVPVADNGSDAGNDGNGSMSMLGNPMDWMRNARGRRDARMSEDKFAAKNARRAERRGWNDESTSMSNELSTGVSTPTGGSGMGAMEREDGPYGQAPTTSAPTMMTTPAPSMMTTPSTPVMYGPDDFMDQYEPGGETRGREGTSAGKLIYKDRLSAPGMSLSNALITGMDALSANLEQPNFNENMYMPDAWQQVLKDSRTANPMSRGVNPVGPLRGMQIPDIKPLDEGRRWSNGSGNLLSGQTPYSGYSKMGGNTYAMGGDINDYYYNDIDTDMYEEGGTYELDQDAIDEIINNGGTVQYI